MPAHRFDQPAGVEPREPSDAPKHALLEDFDIAGGNGDCVLDPRALIERRAPPDSWDSDQLSEGSRALVNCFTAVDAERSCDEIMRTVLATKWVEDDIAVLVVRRVEELCLLDG